MNVESLKNKVNKRVTVANKKIEFNEVGSYLKRKRKELRITQDEIAKGICSISYLSKIENNQIVPKEFYVKELFSRMNISSDIYQATVNDSLYLENALDAFFYYDSKLLDETYNLIKNIENNIPLTIIKYIYFVYNSNSQASFMQKELENLIVNMETIELKIYLLISAVQYANDSQHKKAIEILAANKKLKLANDKIRALIYYYEYISKQHLGLVNYSSEDFYKYINISSKYHNNYRKMNLVLMRLNFLSEENPKEVLKLLDEININTLEAEQRDHYYLIKGMNEIVLNMTARGKISLLKVNEASNYDIAKYVYLYQVAIKESNAEDKIIYSKKIKDFKYTKQNLKHKVFFRVIDINNEDDLKGYLKDIAIPYSIEIEDLKSLKSYTFMLMDICANNARYKESTQHFKKYQKELIKLRSF